MTDCILEISYDSADGGLEEIVQSRLFLTASTGSSWTELGGVTTITAWFDSREQRDVAMALFDELDVHLGVDERERVDWLELYEQSLEPIFIGERFIAAPEESLIPCPSERLSIVIPQEQAFGTGAHESTALCVELLERLDLAGRRCLDVGTGSGILAIAMLRLGAQRVVAFDIDPDAYAALRRNRSRNAIPAEAMPLFIGGIESLRGGTFDVVTMNILPEVIIPMLPSVVPRMGRGSSMIVSGILLTLRDDVVSAAARHSLSLVHEGTKGEWWAGELRNNDG